MSKLSVTLTQGANDAFVQAEIQTGLLGLSRRAYRLNEVQVEFPTAILPGQYELCITRRSKSAMPDLTDLDVFRKWKFAYTFTTSGSTVIETTFVWTPPSEIIIVEDPIYAQLDTALTSAANTVKMLLDVSQVEISEIDRLTLLTQSLQQQ